VPWPPGFSADKDGYADWLTAELSVGRQIARGVPAGVAAEMAAHHDETMSRSILGLYRSAAPNVSADWGADIDGPAAAPGMVVIPTADTFDDEALSRQMAGRLGAQVAVLDGGTHWWMFDPTATVAGILEDFWK
jgi:pimeloyl-ACP methyl ester carboxylesterase